MIAHEELRRAEASRALDLLRVVHSADPQKYAEALTEVIVGQKQDRAGDAIAMARQLGDEKTERRLRRRKTALDFMEKQRGG